MKLLLAAACLLISATTCHAGSDPIMDRIFRDAEASQIRDAMVNEAGVFVPKSYPISIIAAGVAQIAPDPDNTYLHRISARHNGPHPMDFDFCGSFSRRNAAGYNEDPTTFYGTYVNGAVPHIITGAKAQTSCMRRIFKP